MERNDFLVPLVVVPAVLSVVLSWLKYYVFR